MVTENFQTTESPVETIDRCTAILSVVDAAVCDGDDMTVGENLGYGLHLVICGVQAALTAAQREISEGGAGTTPATFSAVKEGGDQ